MRSEGQAGGAAEYEARGPRAHVRVLLARVRLLLDADAVAVHVRDPGGTAALSRIPGSDAVAHPGADVLDDPSGDDAHPATPAVGDGGTEAPPGVEETPATPGDEGTAAIPAPGDEGAAATPNPGDEETVGPPGAAVLRVPLGPEGAPAALLSAVRFDGRPFAPADVERARAVAGLLWAGPRRWALPRSPSGRTSAGAPPAAGEGGRSEAAGEAADADAGRGAGTGRAGEHAGLGEGAAAGAHGAGAHESGEADVVADALLELAHELRSPLAAVVGAAGALAPEASAEQRAFVEILVRNARRALRLIDDAAGGGAGPSGGPERFRRVDVGALVADAVEDAVHAGRLHGVRLRLVLPGPGEATVLGDAGALTQAVDNVLVNAGAYTPAGGVVTVSVVPVRRDATVRIEVRDTGAGIAPADRMRVFERFERGEAAAETGTAGSGLGLAVVRRVVTAHGGTAIAAEAPDGSTRIKLVLPAAPDEEGAPAGS